MANKNAIENLAFSKDELMSSDNWISEYGDYLYRYAFIQLKSQPEAEDVVQDTLLSAYKARDQFQGKSSVKTWLTTILRNKIIDHIRKNKKHSNNEQISINDDSVVNSTFNSYGVWTKWINSWASSPEVLAEQKDFMNQLSSCLVALPNNLRQVFVLRNVENLSTEEISEKLDISANNVWVILYRSRMRLRECLEKNWFSK